MKRRTFLKKVALGSTALGCGHSVLLAPPNQDGTSAQPAIEIEPALREDWLARWEKGILGDSNNRYCDKETGEELGWKVSPFLNGFYYGYLATHNPKWVDMLCDWMDACMRRSVEEPDGFPGWPKGDGGGGESNDYTADSLLGEAMMLRPVVLMSIEIRRRPELESRFGAKSRSYLTLAEQIFKKWDSRDAWRKVPNGGLWIVPQFGISPNTHKWSAGYDQRKTTGFSSPDNKENHIARWLLAMFDATNKTVYQERAVAWFELMKFRMKTVTQGKYCVWNYWEPAGPWDFKPDGSPKHWVGVHPNGGYYAIDVDAITAAFEHGRVFERSDIDRLIATNRDFMWNRSIEQPRFQRIDGGQPDPRWKNSPGVLWTALLPYDETLRRIFISHHDPASWGGLASTPWFLSLART